MTFLINFHLAKVPDLHVIVGVSDPAHDEVAEATAHLQFALKIVLPTSRP